MLLDGRELPFTHPKHAPQLEHPKYMQNNGYAARTLRKGMSEADAQLYLDQQYPSYFEASNHTSATEEAGYVTQAPGRAAAARRFDRTAVSRGRRSGL